MVKLNYTGRKISGVKAGQIVSKDLRKRIPPGSASKAAARDPHTELDISGKNLTDDGFAEFIDDIIDCIQHRDEDHPQGVVKITELSLKGNNLTTASMRKLGHAIALSRDSLTRLDISENDICVANEKQEEEWRCFLESFQECYMLKKIDFGHNNLGSAGFEVLNRVYAKSELDFIVSDGQDKHQAEPQDNNHENGVPEAMDKFHLEKGKDKCEGSGSEHGTADGYTAIMDSSPFASTRGLRSVPYLVFSNACATNAGAFHLWNIIMNHRPPAKLLEYLPAGKSMAPLECEPGTCGIIHEPNEDLEELGRRLLSTGVKECEKLWASEWHEGQLSDSGGAEYDGDGAIIEKREAERKAQIKMERVKNRLLLTVIKAEGMHSVPLWIVAFRMMAVARAILLGPKPNEELGDGGDELESERRAIDNGHIHNTPATKDRSVRNFSDDFPSLKTHSRKASANSGSPKSTRRLHPQAERESSSFDYNPAAASVNVHPFTKITSHAAHTEPGRFGLPLSLWKGIISDAVEGTELLNEEQQLMVLRYASNWASIDQEMRIKGGTEFEQQWKVLSSMDCLSYRK